jgi:hypothetical protein
MPAIPQFPSDLADLHHAWHQPAAHPDLPTRLHPMGSQGGGNEFLTFHRDFMVMALDWYNHHVFTEDIFDDPGHKASLVAPWGAVPVEMRNHDLAEWAHWEDDDARLDHDPKNPPVAPDFVDNDDIGFFIESGIHNNFLHPMAALVYNEPIVDTFHSVESTYFYKIHGLVQHWWSLWARRNVFRGKATFDPHRPVRGATPDWAKGSTIFNPHRSIPSRFSELSDPQFDPRQIESLTIRVQRLEQRTFPRSIEMTGERRGGSKIKKAELAR